MKHDVDRELCCVRTYGIRQLLSLQLARAHTSRASRLFPSVISQLPAKVCNVVRYVFGSLCCTDVREHVTQTTDNAEVEGPALWVCACCCCHLVCFSSPVLHPAFLVLLPVLPPATPANEA